MNTENSTMQKWEQVKYIINMYAGLLSRVKWYLQLQRFSLPVAQNKWKCKFMIRWINSKSITTEKHHLEKFKSNLSAKLELISLPLVQLSIQYVGKETPTEPQWFSLNKALNHILFPYHKSPIMFFIETFHSLSPPTMTSSVLVNSMYNSYVKTEYMSATVLYILYSYEDV